MRTPLVIACLTLGALAGWVGHELLARPVAEPVDALGLPDAGDPEPSASPALLGSADPRMAALGADAGRAARALGARTAGSPEARQRGLAALAVLQAVAGSEAEFLAVARQALQAGASLDLLLPALREFPPEVAARLLGELLPAAGGAPYDTSEVASLLAEGGQPERALALVRDALVGQEEPDAGLLQLLLRLDPQQGPALLLGMGGSELWGAETLGVVRAALIASGQEAALVPFLQRALATQPGDADLLRWLARVDPAAAEQHARARVRTAPDDGKAWGLLGDLRRNAGDALGAFEAYRRAAELLPGRSTYRDLVKADPARGLELVLAWAQGTQDDERLGALGEAYLAAGKQADAFAAFQRAHDNDPSDRMWVERMIELDANATVAALGQRIAAARDATDDRLLGRYAQALAAAGRTDEAFAQYLAAYQKRPQDGSWQLALARTDPQRAVPVLMEHVRAHPQDVSAQGAYGVALAAAGRREEALRQLEGAMARGDASRWYGPLARVDAERALGALESRTRSTAYDPDLWSMLGAELGRRGRTAEARQAYEAALRLDPSDRAAAEALRALR